MVPPLARNRMVYRTDRASCREICYQQRARSIIARRTSMPKPLSHILVEDVDVLIADLSMAEALAVLRVEGG